MELQLQTGKQVLMEVASEGSHVAGVCKKSMGKEVSDSTEIRGRKGREAVLLLQPPESQQTNDSSHFLRAQTWF